MSDLINKQKAIDEIRAFQSQITLDGSTAWINGMDEGFDHAVSVIELMDTVDAIPIEWIWKYWDDGDKPKNYALHIRDMIEEYKAEREECESK